MLFAHQPGPVIAAYILRPGGGVGAGGAAGELPRDDECTGNDQQAAQLDQRFGEDDGVEGEHGDDQRRGDIFAPVAPADGVAETPRLALDLVERSEEHTSELQSLMRISYAVFCLKKKKRQKNNNVQ